MAKEAKKRIRADFNEACKYRDGYKCRLCTPEENELWVHAHAEVHHIRNREDMPNGGYVKENGITLCPGHHLKVERYPHEYPTWMLYGLIGSSYQQALDASKRLC